MLIIIIIIIIIIMSKTVILILTYHRHKPIDLINTEMYLRAVGQDNVYWPHPVLKKVPSSFRELMERRLPVSQAGFCSVQLVS
jgi:hypothetical protein